MEPLVIVHILADDIHITHKLAHINTHTHTYMCTHTHIHVLQHCNLLHHTVHTLSKDHFLCFLSYILDHQETGQHQSKSILVSDGYSYPHGS